jgi:hypothetical protein
MTLVWLDADGEYEKALSAVGKVRAADEWLSRLVPGEVNLDAKERELEKLRARIAGTVAAARVVADHEQRLQKISTIQADLQPGNRASYTSALTQLRSEIATCGRCRTGTELKKAASSIEAELERWPVDIASIQEMMTRYADLRGRKARVRGRLTASTYYNCRFGSQSQWRSFQLSDSLLRAVHVYCGRGDEGCEAIFNKLAAGGGTSGTSPPSSASST